MSFNNKAEVLIVDDDKFTRETLYRDLKNQYSSFMVDSAENAFDFLSKHRVNIVLLDINLGENKMDGITALRKMKSEYPECEVIMISATKKADIIIEAMQAGAYHYFTKDLDYSEIVLNINNALNKQEETKQKLFYKAEIDHYTEQGFLVGGSSKMRSVYRVIEQIAGLDINVLITGKSGTGKELAARIIHEKSNRRDHLFVPVNMASLPENLVESILFGHEKGAFTGASEEHIGKFEMANEGTIFLDEIGELKMDLQAKLNRVLQEGEIEVVGSRKSIKVDVRLVAASNVDFHERMGEGQFREDLFYRLNVIPINLPTLLERIEDIPLLAQFFIERYRKKFNKPTEEITKEALEVLSRYPWPGNIREFENLIARIIALSNSKNITVDDIPIEYHLKSLIKEKSTRKNNSMLVVAVEAFERNCIIQALKKNKMSRKKAAEGLGMPLSTFKFKLNRLGILKFLKDDKDTHYIQ